MRLARTSALSACILAALSAGSLRAQSLDDGMLVPRRALQTGLLYAHESWDHYWEGSLNRVNGNIGTLSTQSVTWMAGYGVTDRLSVMASLPYIRTHASQGPLHDMSGVQDLTLAAKYRLLSTPFTDKGTMKVFVVGAAGVPIGNYTPDFLPLSIGLASQRYSGRLTLNFQSHAGWFLNGSGAYTMRNKVKLDRPAYYTDGQLYLSDEVAMPDVLDYAVSLGYQRGRLCIPLSLVQQRTLGGGDIRRQDMPFVSNRMNFVKADAMLMYTLSEPRNLAIRAGVSRVLSGRNVGEATAFTGGLFYTFHF